ncbi:MAG TPA: hypothetical protein VKS60_20465 [Stellaceae bacterium]|nr:hypothetical protein [Stellaceae bacterium]
MTRFTKFASLAGLFALTAAASVLPAQAGDAAAEREAVVTGLSPNASALTYWVGEDDGWHVVTIVDTVTGIGGDDEHHAVVRFSTVLQPGQSQLISVPSVSGEPQQSLRIERSNDRVEVTRVGGNV